ncbi:MAG: hypothetical protein D6732_04120 [Methanobacteriota archaeon]|nr:MAG: hypothetical protein D6732_04120 [Euryarchaeota archaeon]
MDEDAQPIARMPAKDFFIQEAIDKKPSLCRLIGYVVSLDPLSFVLNDGESQIQIEYGSIPTSTLKLMQPFRIICKLQEIEGGIKFIGQFAHKMLPEDFEKYKTIISLERRIAYPE